MATTKKNLTCIICPLGCELSIEFDGEEIKSVSGNTCKRGEKYAISECTDPQRTVTSTVRCDNGQVVAVKTDRTIPKDKIFDCMKIINNAVAHLPISVGDVIIEDVYGAKVIATQNMQGDK